MDAKMPVAIAGLIVVVSLYLSVMVGGFYIGYLVVCALRKYVGG